MHYEILRESFVLPPSYNVKHIPFKFTRSNLVLLARVNRIIITFKGKISICIQTFYFYNILIFG